MRLPFWIKGGFLGIAYVLVISFIKNLCRTTEAEWCFADIFWPFLFQPLLALDYLLPQEIIEFLGENLFKTTLVFWFIMGSLIGLIYGLFKNIYPQDKVLS